MAQNDLLECKERIGKRSSNGQVTAYNVYEMQGAGRRRSSVVIDYFRANYMGIQREEITDRHLQDIQDTFNLLDMDQDGKLTKAELSTLLRYSGSLKSDTEMEGLLQVIDTDHNGSIDFEEFKKFIIEKDIIKSLADEVCYEMQDAFNMFDKDGDGFIDKDELKKVLTQIGDKMPDELADEFIREADLNGDGKIDYNEFCKHMGY